MTDFTDKLPEPEEENDPLADVRRAMMENDDDDVEDTGLVPELPPLFPDDDGDEEALALEDSHPEEQEEPVALSDEQGPVAATPPAARPTRRQGGDFSSVRNIALEEYQDAPLVEEKAGSGKRLKRAYAEMNTLEKVVLFALLAVLLIGLGMGTQYFLLRQRAALATPVPTEPPVETDPYPLDLVFPGGWSFRLLSGVVTEDGQWKPTGPEWLDGSLFCKWIAIPTNTQVEAVKNTFKEGDEFQLVMSNSETLIYTLQSIREVSRTEVQSLQLDQPCMLIILAREDADTRWVITTVR